MKALVKKYPEQGLWMWLLKTFKVLKIDVGIKDLLRKTECSKDMKSLVLAALFEPILYLFFETLGIANTISITAAVILSLSPISSCICECDTYFDVEANKEQYDLADFVFENLAIEAQNDSYTEGVVENMVE